MFANGVFMGSFVEKRRHRNPAGSQMKDIGVETNLGTFFVCKWKEIAHGFVIIII